MTAPTVTVLVPVIDALQDSESGVVRLRPSAAGHLRKSDGAVMLAEPVPVPVSGGNATLTVPISSAFDPPITHILSTPGPYAPEFSGVMPDDLAGQTVTLDTLVQSWGWGIVQEAPEIQVITGPAGMTWSNPLIYNPATTYPTNAGVFFNGGTWRSLAPTTGHAPPSDNSVSNAYWAAVGLPGVSVPATATSTGAVLLDFNPVSGNPIAATKPIVEGISVNARTYGAKGDGSTADATAINAAIAAAGNGGTVTLPVTSAGSTYMLDAPLNGAIANVKLLAGGPGITLKRSGSGAMMSGDTGTYTGWKVEGLTFDGNWVALGLASQREFNLYNCIRTLFRDCTFTNLGNGVGAGGMTGFRLEDCHYLGTYPGVMAPGVQYPTANPLAAYSAGFYPQTGNTDMAVKDCTFDFCFSGITQLGSVFNTSRGFKILNSRFRGDFWLQPYVTARFQATAFDTSTRILTAPAGTNLGVLASAAQTIAFRKDVTTGTTFTTLSRNALTVPTPIADVSVGDVFETADGRRAEIETIIDINGLGISATSPAQVGAVDTGLHVYVSTATINGVETSIGVPGRLNVNGSGAQQGQAGVVTLGRPSGLPTGVTTWTVYRSAVIPISGFSTTPGQPWNGERLYKVGDAVVYGRSAWLCLVQNRSSVPATGNWREYPLYQVVALPFATTGYADVMPDSTLVTGSIHPPSVRTAVSFMMRGWEDIATSYPIAQPSTTVNWTLSRYYASITVGTSTDTSATLLSDPYHPPSGRQAIGDDGLNLTTLPAVVYAKANYAGIQVSGGQFDLVIDTCTFRGAFADQASVFDSFQPRITNNHFEFGEDQAITSQRNPRAIVTGNTVKNHGTGMYLEGNNSIASGNIFHGWGLANPNIRGAIQISGNNSVIIGNSFSRDWTVTRGTDSGGHPAAQYAIGIADDQDGCDGITVKGNTDTGSTSGTLFVNSGSVTNLLHDVPVSRVVYLHNGSPAGIVPLQTPLVGTTSQMPAASLTPGAFAYLSDVPALKISASDANGGFAWYAPLLADNLLSYPRNKGWLGVGIVNPTSPLTVFANQSAVQTPSSGAGSPLFTGTTPLISATATYLDAATSTFGHVETFIFSQTADSSASVQGQRIIAQTGTTANNMGTLVAQRSQASYLGTGGTTNFLIGGNFTASTGAASTGAVTTAEGATGSVTHSGSGTVGSGYGLLGTVSLNASSSTDGAITAGIGLSGSVANNLAAAGGKIVSAFAVQAQRPSGTGDITHAYGLYAQNQNQANVKTDSYGLFIADQTGGPVATPYALFTQGTALSSFGGSVLAPSFAPAGTVGAASASRYVGATPSGAPTLGTFVIGDWVVDRTTGGRWTCTVAGTPGTWVATAMVGSTVGSVTGTAPITSSGGASPAIGLALSARLATVSSALDLASGVVTAQSWAFPTGITTDTYGRVTAVTTAGVSRQTVTGSRTDGTALASLLTAFVNLGFIIDSSTA